ncbi:MAG: Bacterial membrane protein YfhO [candidate division BRC1 bacterium ADurb.BinA364]|nr:MAG: Bacterial membrane protein YfhO [candidate division BRC1 bacterium ADurb.BinA364]
MLGAALLHSWQGASPLLYRSLPGYAHFHDPKRALALAVLAACVLGGIGAAAAFGRAAEAPKRRLGFWLALALAVLDVGAAKALAPIAPQRPWALEWPALGWFGWPFGATDLNWILWGALAWAAFWTAMAGANKAPRAAAFALIAGMGLELWLFSAARNDLKTVRADRFFPAGVASSSSPMAKALGAAGSLASPAGGAARFFSFDTRAQYSYDYARLDTRLFPNMASYYGLEDVQGYDAFKLKPYVRTLAAINLGATNLYPSHFGLISNPASPLLNRLCARFAEGQADALPALPVPPAAPGEPIRPAIRLRPLDEPATATLVFEAYFPAMPPNGAPDPGWARIAFPLTDGRSMPEARSLFGAEYILKQSDAAWIGGRWTGRLPAGAGTPEIHLSDPAARLVVLDYWETTPSSASPWRRLIPARADLPPWFESRGAEPLISLWPRAAFASPSSASGGDRGALLLERDQPLPAFAWPDGQGTGRVLSARIRSSRVDIRAEAPAGGAFLLLRDAWAPGWTAQVDGRPAPLLRADGMFRAVPLDAGEREIVFRYRAPGLAAGLALAAAGLAGLAGLCAASCKARTTRRKTSS